MGNNIFTIGHSVQDASQFLERLKQHGVAVVADVRSAPYSRRNPQFNREELRFFLKSEGIRYVFLGKELGARSTDERCYVNGKVQYDLLKNTEVFKAGISRVLEGIESYRIALMCAEKDPLDCHRTILVARELVRHGVEIKHILEDGSLESHSDAMLRLIERLGLENGDMFKLQAMAIEDAYEKQGERIAYDRRSLEASPALLYEKEE